MPLHPAAPVNCFRRLKGGRCRTPLGRPETYRHFRFLCNILRISSANFKITLEFRVFPLASDVLRNRHNVAEMTAELVAFIYRPPSSCTCVHSRRNKGNEKSSSCFVCTDLGLRVLQLCPGKFRQFSCAGPGSKCLYFRPSGMHHIQRLRPDQRQLNASTCKLAGVPDLPSGSDFGCAILFNLTLPPENITSLNVTFAGLGDLTFDCPTTAAASIFSQSSCGSSGPGTDTFSFFDGSLPFFHEAVIYESGVSPDLFQDGTGNVNQPPFVPTPEPDSILLLSTGVMMFGGAYFAKRRQLFAFGKK